MGFTTKCVPFAIYGDNGDRDAESHTFTPSISPLSPLPPHREIYTFKITLFSYSWILQSYPQGQRHFYGDKDIGYFGGKAMGTKTLVYGDKDIFMGTKESEVVRMSLVGWLVGLLLAPVFITIGLGVLVISGLFGEVEGDE